MRMVVVMNGHLHLHLYLHLGKDGDNGGDGWPRLPPSPEIHENSLEVQRKSIEVQRNH